MTDGLRVRLRVDRGAFRLDVDLDLPLRGISALFGHSGSGKTTVLRAIAGLERASGGVVALGDEVWQDDARGVFVPVHRRAIGYVFQEASLFPHLSVRANLEFGRKRVPVHERRFALEPVTALLGIENLLERRPDGLSGGERQRVAIARALLASPRLLLMDEPLAALDLRRKLEILPYLERMHGELAIPIVYVSHAPDEVARLADHLVLLDDGKAVASGPLSETLARVDLPPSFADDAGVVLDTILAGHEEDALSRLEFAGGALFVGRRREAVGTRLRCRIHARDVSLALDRPQGTSIVNRLPAVVTAVSATDTPGHVLVQLRMGESPLLARITERSRRELGIAPGLRLWVQIKGVALLN
ncbi:MULTISPECIES: molybdenum ABC transporter ATP-binding protein [Massilia]|jgi:molybdate transport system ATP-binding protein|uniref:Molybdenum ABC transporter ATP-binding protein n=2 Tax=Massilia TaxID=149698 RepID=A0A7X3K6N8_9BURK|nr:MULTISPECIES: molybdenum ABC transporter ATP-binding protein [Telluria group]KQY00001.1 molybdenum ABC transporter ATP-binding protein [Massilia sp. Root133]KQZ39269.1 molybdenum ABC transporter ATP-binding protein [Massilia sp. Root1485]MDN4046251.1 molybdenum ABC transporter ATP-binding protein [Massilia sp. YIM B02787]MVW59071.1 molybdenum ABC transporter ATP-binding protein [Telluria cellulosilytica]